MEKNIYPVRSCSPETRYNNFVRIVSYFNRFNLGHGSLLSDNQASFNVDLV